MTLLRTDFLHVPTNNFHRLRKDQPIMWSTLDVTESTRMGLGVQQTYGEYAKQYYPHAFASHTKVALKESVQEVVDNHCRKQRGCYANYTESGHLKIGCDKGNTLAKDYA